MISPQKTSGFSRHFLISFGGFFAWSCGGCYYVLILKQESCAPYSPLDLVTATRSLYFLGIQGTTTFLGLYNP
jgi:hypothetical protein